MAVLPTRPVVQLREPPHNTRQANCFLLIQCIAPHPRSFKAAVDKATYDIRRMSGVVCGVPISPADSEGNSCSALSMAGPDNLSILGGKVIIAEDSEGRHSNNFIWCAPRLGPLARTGWPPAALACASCVLRCLPGCIVQHVLNPPLLPLPCLAASLFLLFSSPHAHHLSPSRPLRVCACVQGHGPLQE